MSSLKEKGKKEGGKKEEKKEAWSYGEVVEEQSLE